jgi:hypothetical protein
MENTNDKTAVQIPDGCNVTYFANGVRHAMGNSGEVFSKGQMQAYGDDRAEEARREAYARGRGDAVREYIGNGTVQRTTGGGGVSPSHGGGMGSTYNPASDQRGGMAGGTAGGDAATNVDWLGHALDLEAQARRVESNTARRAMLGGAHALRLMGTAQPVAEAAATAATADTFCDGNCTWRDHAPGCVRAGAAAQADDVRAQFNGFDITKLPPILTSCVAKLWPGSNGLFWESALEKMPGRIEQLMQNLAAAPTAQPTQTEQMKALWTPELLAQCEEDSAEVRAVVAAQPTPKGPEVGCERDDGLLNIHAESKTCEVCRAQPTPPDAEPMTGATAPGWVAGPATPLDRLTRYGFDGTLGGDFDENADGPYVKLEDVRAALRQPGALAKPLTRRDINFVKQPPGVIALTLAILWHDGAERPLYTRDDQIAWTGIDAGGHEKSVTVGQLREVLVAALGLPVGTKFGG